MIVDYFIIRKGNLDIEDMYNLDKMGTYWYTGGVNWRAFLSFVVGFLLPFPGFVASFGYEIGSAATHLYELGWVLSFLMGGLCYWLLCIVFKVPGYNKSAEWEEKVSLGETESAEGSNVQEV